MRMGAAVSSICANTAESPAMSESEAFDVDMIESVLFRGEWQSHPASLFRGNISGKSQSGRERRISL